MIVLDSFYSPHCMFVPQWRMWTTGIYFPAIPLAVFIWRVNDECIEYPGRICFNGRLFILEFIYPGSSIGEHDYNFFVFNQTDTSYKWVVGARKIHSCTTSNKLVQLYLWKCYISISMDRGIICAIERNGNCNNAENFRGITGFNVLDKL